MKENISKYRIFKRDHSGIINCNRNQFCNDIEITGNVTLICKFKVYKETAQILIGLIRSRCYFCRKISTFEEEVVFKLGKL